MSRKFFAADGAPFSDSDAQSLGPELVSLAERGASAPADIVEYARREDTPLYEALHMDKPLDEVAEKWYRRRARQVASSIMVKVQTSDGDYREVRAFHSVTVTTSEGEGGSAPVKRVYASIDQVQESEAMASQVIDDALRRLERWKDRYEDYRDVLTRHHPELEGVFSQIEKVA